MPTILDVNFGSEFWGWPETPGKTRPKNSLSKFRHQNSLRNIAGNFPKIRRTKIKNSLPNPLCITSGPRNGSMTARSR